MSGRNARLERLIFLSDGVYAIALTLLAVELVLPESSMDLHDGRLLKSLLESWPRVLAFLTSFTIIANFWVGHNVLFQHLRGLDGGLMWLALLQLLCIAFIPFPTSVIGAHIADPVAQQFYFATLLISALVMYVLWWYMTSHQLLKPDLSPDLIRRTHVISLSVPVTMLVLMALVTVGVGRLINPLLLFAFVTIFFIALGVREWREDEGGSPATPDTTEKSAEPHGPEGGP